MIDEVILYRLKYIYNQINVVQKGWISYYHDKLVSVQYQLSIIRKLYLIWVYILVVFGNYGFYFSCKNKCSLFEYNYELYVSYNYITLLLYRFLNVKLYNFTIAKKKKLYSKCWILSEFMPSQYYQIFQRKFLKAQLWFHKLHETTIYYYCD